MLFAAFALASSSIALLPASTEQTRQETPRKTTRSENALPPKQRPRKAGPKREDDGDGWCRTDGMTRRCSLFASPAAPIL